MKMVRGDMVQLLTSGVRTGFLKGFNSWPVEYPKVAVTIPSTKKIETYADLGALHKPREWTGNEDRVEHDLSEYSFTVTNKKYEDTLPVSREALEDEQTGQIPDRAQTMGSAFASYVDELVFTELMAGFSTACYDGQNFFSNSHSEKSSGTQDNLITTALSINGVMEAWAAGMQFKDDQGRYTPVNLDTLVVNPAQASTAWKIVNSERDWGDANGAANPAYKRFDVIVRPEITSGYYIVVAGKYPIKPVIWQERVKAEVELDKTQWLSNDVLIYAGRMRGRVALGQWRLAVGSSGGN